MKKVLILFIILLLSGGGYYYYDNFLNKKKEDVSSSNEYSPMFLQEDYLDAFLTSVNKLSFENKTLYEIDRVKFNEVNSFVSVRIYDNNSLLELNIEGDITASNRKLRERSLHSINNTTRINNSIQGIKNSINFTSCDNVPSDHTFLYINKGLTVTLRNNKQFINFNILDDKMFVWEEFGGTNSTFRKETSSYMLCDLNNNTLLSNIGNLINILSRTN